MPTPEEEFAMQDTQSTLNFAVGGPDLNPEQYIRYIALELACKDTSRSVSTSLAIAGAFAKYIQTGAK